MVGVACLEVADLAVQPRDLAERGQGVGVEPALLQHQEQQLDEEARRVAAVSYAVAGQQEHEAGFGCVLLVDEVRKP